MTKRITPDDVVAAYQATGMHPRHRTYFTAWDDRNGNRITCGCPVVALALHSGCITEAEAVDMSEERLVFIASTLGYDFDYLCAFIKSFDMRDQPLDASPEGVADGYEVWKLI